MNRVALACIGVAAGVTIVTQVSAVIPCFHNISVKCFDVIDTYGPLPNLDRVCGIIPCADTITINPNVNGTREILEGETGKTGIEADYSFYIQWTVRWCASTGGTACAAGRPPVTSSSIGYPAHINGPVCGG